MGVLGAAIDYGRAYNARSYMQMAADGAALAAASMENATDSERIAQAMDTFAANFIASELGTPPTPTVTIDSENVTVAANAVVPLYVLPILKISNAPVAVNAIATLKVTLDPCFYSLEPISSKAVHVDGDAEIRTKKCVASVNSTATDAVIMDGGSEWDAQKVTITGNYVESGGEIDASEGVEVNFSSQNDPYLLVDIPSFSGCSGGTALEITSDTSLMPGVFCDGLTIRNGAEVTLNPGLYIIDRGDLFLEEISEIEGDGVVIFLTSSGSANQIGSLRITDHSQIDITSPTAGIYAGIAIYQDRNAPAVWSERDPWRVF